MNAYADILAADMRIVILRALEEDSGYSLNDSVLQSVLAAFGHRVSRDRVKTELDWLAEQGFVTLENISTVTVATITRRGADVACGRVITAGVKRPGPRC